jgi:Domain of unknown function (DUF4177)
MSWTWHRSAARFDSYKFDQEISKHGREGWELVQVFEPRKEDGESEGLIAVFKRPVA